MHKFINLMRITIKKIAKAISLFLFPPLCIGCRHYSEKRNQLCTNCKNSLEPVVSHELSITNTRSATVYACARYSGIIQKLIRLKNYKQPQGSYVLGTMMAEQFHTIMHDVDYIIPVPLHWTRRLWRGFNQAEIIAHTCSLQWHIPISCPLVRIKKTPQLTKLSKKDRAVVLSNCFALTSKALREKKCYKNTTVAIVDDLCTSGATVREMSILLYSLGVKEVRVIVAARTC